MCLDLCQSRRDKSSKLEVDLRALLTIVPLLRAQELQREPGDGAMTHGLLQIQTLLQTIGEPLSLQLQLQSLMDGTPMWKVVHRLAHGVPQQEETAARCRQTVSLKDLPTQEHASSAGKTAICPESALRIKAEREAEAASNVAKRDTWLETALERKCLRTMKEVTSHPREEVAASSAERTDTEQETVETLKLKDLKREEEETRTWTTS